MDKYAKDYFSELEKAEIIETPRNLRILNFLEKHSSKGKILDVGVGTGLFLKLARKSGWDVYGVDISDYATEKLKKIYKNIYKGELQKLKLPNDFDAINMRHTIEHVKNPEKDLKKANQILKTGGVICIATPNSNGIHAKFFGKLWPHLALPYHLHFFSKKSLNKLIESCGFEILESKTEELTSYDLFRLGLNMVGLKVSFGNPTKISKLINKSLTKVGLGEGLVVVARKK